MADDLILRFLDLDQFAKLGRLAGLAFANDFRVRLEHTHDFYLTWSPRQKFAAWSVSPLVATAASSSPAISLSFAGECGEGGALPSPLLISVVLGSQFSGLNSAVRHTASFSALLLLHPGTGSTGQSPEHASAHSACDPVPCA